MILSDRDLRTYLKRGELVITPLEDIQIQPCSIDLRLASEIQRFRRAPTLILNAREKQDENLKGETIPDGEWLLLFPGDRVLARTLETVQLPATLAGKLEGRSTYARLFITVHQTGGWIDPGFRGTIVLEIANFNELPVALWPGDRCCQLVLYPLSSPALRTYGHRDLGSKYQDQAKVVGSRVDHDHRRPHLPRQRQARVAGRT